MSIPPHPNQETRLPRLTDRLSQKYCLLEMDISQKCLCYIHCLIVLQKKHIQKRCSNLVLWQWTLSCHRKKGHEWTLFGIFCFDVSPQLSNTRSWGRLLPTNDSHRTWHLVRQSVFAQNDPYFVFPAKMSLKMSLICVLAQNQPDWRRVLPPPV